MPDPKPPRRSLRPSVQIDSDGTMKFSYKFIVGVLIALGVIGGGSGTAINHGVNLFGGGDAEQDERLDQHDGEIAGLTVTIGEIQSTQHWQASDQAAVRLCANEVNRNACEKRLIRTSIDRMKYEGKTRPCTNLDCTD